jgi:pimeloyl-ACP methyl ester carboxylesterase
VKKVRIAVYTTKQGKARLGVVKIAYEVTHPLEEERETPGLIFVGGWGESGQTWRQQVDFFAPRFPTLTYDRRGLGQSSHPDYQDAYTMEEELADLGKVLTVTGLAERPLWLIGHSFGGHLLVHWLLREQANHHTQAKKLVLLAPTSRAVRDEDTPFGSSSKQEVCERNAALLRGDFTYLQQYAQQAIPEGGQATEALRQAIAHVVPAIMPAHIAVWTFTLYFSQDVRPLLPGLQLPALVISGERDPTMPPTAGADVTARLPQAKQVVIPQAGHLLHLTAAATVNRLIDEFLVDS